MPTQRVERVQNLLRSEIATVIQRRLKDPRVAMVTISSVRVSPDLHEARVLISIYGNDAARETALEGLRSAAGFIRSNLMKVLHLRPVPRLEFEVDESLERGGQTLDLLERVRHEREASDAGAEPGSSTDSEQ